MEMAVCKYCGQVSNFEVPENATHEEALEIGTMHCSCPPARIYQGKQEKAKIAKTELSEMLLDDDDIVKYLIINGVIVPPCKVGEKAYFVLEVDEEWQICEKMVVDFSTKGFYYSEFLEGTGAQILVPYDEIGENVFFDKAKAEAKLKECEGNE